MDIEQWLSEIASEPPCGPDLEYDSEFLSFDQLARGKPEQQYGDTLIAAEEPDWRAVDRAATSLFQRSKDFRVACVVARAWTRMHGMTGFANGLALNLGLLERYWDSVHPRLDIDGEYDPVPRSNALNILGNADGLMRDFRAAALLQGVGAPILVRDAEAILASGADSAVMSRSQLTAMLVNAHTAGSPELQALLRAQQSLGTIRQICLDKLGPESSPDLADLSALLSQLLHPITSQQGAEQPEIHRPQPGAAGADRVRRRGLRRREEGPAAVRHGGDGRSVRQARRAAAGGGRPQVPRIDVDNFDERMKAMKPRVAFQVPNTLTGEGNLSVDITFESMDDFSPAAVARKVGRP
jgi:type VI secretion system protein ImpA